MKYPKLIVGLLFLICIMLFVVSVATAQMDHSGHNMGGMPGMSSEEHEKMQLEQGSSPKADQIMVTPERQQLIGVKTEIAKAHDLKKTIRTVGTVAFDPELYAAQSEYSEAVQAREEARKSEDPRILENAEELVAAARLKLERTGLSESLIKKTDKEDPSLLIGSEKGLVWIYGKIYENEIPLVKEGLTVHVTASGLPGKLFMGKIAAIDTVLDEMTRSLKVRAMVMNEKGQLKPNMFVNVVIEASLGKKLAVSEDAVLDTGEKQILFVDQGKGMFEKRFVVAGERAGGMIEILKGVKVGEKIVTAGTFLIDSESKLKATGGGGHVH